MLQELIHLDIPGGEQIVKESYAQMRKFNCWNISIVQQYSRFKESCIRSAVFGNSPQFFLMRQNDRADLDDMGRALGSCGLFLMDYPRRERLKILSRARVLDAREHTDLAEQLSPSPAMRGKIERLFLIEAVSYDWNCPQTITPRFTEAEIEAHTAPLKARIAELKAQAAARKG